MMTSLNLAKRTTQHRFGLAVGITQSTVSQLIAEGRLDPDGTAGEWLTAYCAHLREQAAGRAVDGTTSLVRERAALAREQAEAAARANALARGELAPIGLLADVLGTASAAVRDRFDQLDGALRKACPDLPEQARATVQATIASARNEWVRATASLVEAKLLGDDGPVDEEG